MTRMTFGDYVWMDNPEVFHQKFVREPQYVTSSGSVLFAGMSALKRTITGSGCFVGDGAIQSFLSLASLCDGTPRKLTHPVYGEINAYLTCLEMTQDTLVDHVEYSFTFREANANNIIPK